MTNTNANTDDMVNADVSADASQESMVGAITTVFETTFQQLIAIRDSTYANAIGALDSELEALAKEHAQLQTAIYDIEAMLPAKARLTQHDVDVLLVSGKPDARQDAKAKMDELKEIQRKPTLLRQQQKECIARSEAIASEKRSIAKQVFETWYTEEVQPTVRVFERGLFITFLEGLSKDFYEFQDRVGMSAWDNRTRPLLHQGHLTGLTAEGRSAEWAAGHKWYG